MSHDGDSWGQCMMFSFAIAGCLYRHGTVPDEWEFKPGLSEAQPPIEWPDIEIESVYQDDKINLNELTNTGNIFIRYANIFRTQNKDY